MKPHFSLRELKARLQRRRFVLGQSGQSTVEYLLLMFVVVVAIVMVMGRMKESQFFYKRFTEPLVRHVVYNYKYGDPRAQGWDEGTPRLHIQIQEPAGQTFRMFQPTKTNK